MIFVTLKCQVKQQTVFLIYIKNITKRVIAIFRFESWITKKNINFIKAKGSWSLGINKPFARN